MNAEVLPSQFYYSLNLFQRHYKEDNINLIPGLNNFNKCLESFVVPHIPVCPIHYVKTIDPHTHLLFLWFTMALNPLFTAHKMIKCCRFIILSNQSLAPDKALIPGRTNTLKTIQILQFSHLYHLANGHCTACMLFDNLCLLHVAYSHSFKVHF